MQLELKGGMRLVPDNFGPLKQASANARFTGPCGDTMEFWLRFVNARVSQASYTSDGCHHSQLSGSAAAWLAIGRTVGEINELTPEQVCEVVGVLPPGHEHCARLAVRTLKLTAATWDGTEQPARTLRQDSPTEERQMRIAIPMTNGKLSMHFGHCEQFAIFDADADTGNFSTGATLTPPAHEPGLLPRWLGDQGVNVVIAGGMGQRAVALFNEHGIQVITGAAELEPVELAAAYLAGQLRTGDNVCDH